MQLKYKIFLVFLIIAIDQSCKQALRLIGSNFIILNTGISFGLLSRIGNGQLAMINFLLTLIFSVFLFKKTTIVGSLAVILIIGGSFGNLIDRLSLGGVLDYISIWRLPVFNISDLAITTGSFMLLLKLVFNQKI